MNTENILNQETSNKLNEKLQSMANTMSAGDPIIQKNHVEKPRQEELSNRNDVENPRLKM